MTLILITDNFPRVHNDNCPCSVEGRLCQGLSIPRNGYLGSVPMDAQNNVFSACNPVSGTETVLSRITAVATGHASCDLKSRYNNTVYMVVN